jgi:hypothetical protein
VKSPSAGPLKAHILYWALSSGYRTSFCTSFCRWGCPSRLRLNSETGRGAGKFLQGHLECEPRSVNHCHQVNLRVNMCVFALLCHMSTHKICSAYHVQDHARTSDRMSSGCAQHLPTRISARPRSKSSHITALQECSRKLRQNRNEKG